MTVRRWLGVVAVLALTLALLLPAVRDAVVGRPPIPCAHNLRLISLALQNYHSRYGCFPPAAIFDGQGRPLLSWRVAILPFLEQESLYQRFHLNEPWYSPHNRRLLAQMPKIFCCPFGDGRPGEAEMSPYQVIVGPQTVFTGGPGGVRLDEVADGAFKTLMVVETRDPAPWTAPYDMSFTSASTLGVRGSWHPGGFNGLFVDGAVRYIDAATDPGVLQSLTTRNGGESVPDPYDLSP
jgi:prepilin-type processing-associated H-X9-DG protein